MIMTVHWLNLETYTWIYCFTLNKVIGMQIYHLCLQDLCVSQNYTEILMMVVVVVGRQTRVRKLWYSLWCLQH
jgi:hypothetical protein